MNATTEIESGPETDRMVADACGITGLHVRVLGVGIHEYRRYTGDGTDEVPFRPSTDWNDAMLAAERFGLFCDWGFCLLLHDGQWLVADVSVFGKIDYDEGYRHESGPLAICRAILAMRAVSPNG